MGGGPGRSSAFVGSGWWPFLCSCARFERSFVCGHFERAVLDAPRRLPASVDVAYDLLAAKSPRASRQSCYSTAQTRCARERALAWRKILANPTRRGRRLGPPNISRRRDMLPHMWRRRQTPSPRPRNAIHRVYIYRAPREANLRRRRQRVALLHDVGPVAVVLLVVHQAHGMAVREHLIQRLGELLFLVLPRHE